MRIKGKEARAGQIIADRYQLKEALGRGAMGRIWRADQLRLKSQVALKFLDPEIAKDPEMFERFLREAQSAAAVRSAHVVQIFDCGVEGGNPYIAMELLNGVSLDARLNQKGTLTPGELDKIFSEVARAVSNAHEVGVIHRDLKPGNIFIAREGEFDITKVLDFGIAKVLNQSLDSAAHTRTGTVLGTPQYMSPEQVRGLALDHRTDLWSLAVIAFECLTGELPFQGAGIGDVLVQICTCNPLVPSDLCDVPLGFDAWFLRSMSKEPSHRFASARELAESLSLVLAGAPSPATRAGALAERADELAARGGGSASTGPRQLSTEAVPPRPIPSLLRMALLGSAPVLVAPAGLSRARRYGLSFAAPLTILCGAGVLALWARSPHLASEPAGAMGSTTTISMERVRLGTAMAQAPLADAGAPRATAPAARSVPSQAQDAATPAVPWTDSRNAGARAPRPTARWRAGSRTPNGSSKPTAASPVVPRPPASRADLGNPERAARPAREPAPSAPQTTTTARERGARDPFSERL